MLSRDDRDLIARESLPGLECVLDAGAFRELIRSLAPGWESGPFRIIYVRYKPQTNILVGYETRWNGAPYWLTAKAYRSASARKMKPRAVEVPTPLGIGQVVFEPLALVISAFPYDNDIRGMAKLRPPVEVLRYKPERRLVARLGEHVVKLYTRRGYPGALIANTAMQKVMTHDDRRLAITTSWVNGQELSGHLDRAPLARVAEALAAIHRSSGAGLRQHLRAQDIEAVTALGEWLVFLAPPLARDVKAISHELIELLRQVPDESTPVHGDFYAHQVLIDADEATIIDFDEACLSSSYADLATFRAHLDLTSQAAGDALVTAYERVTGKDVDSKRLAFEQGFALFKLAGDPFRQRDPEWCSATAALLERVRRLLHGPKRSAPQFMDLVRQALDARVLASHGIDVESAELLRMREGRRALIEYRGTPPLIGKLRAKGFDSRTFDLNRALRQLGFDESSDVAVPEPVAAVKPLNLWMQRRIDGVMATDALARAGSARFAERAAGALYRLHTANVTVDRRYGVADELRALEDALRAASEARNDLAPRIAAVLGLARDAAADLLPASNALIHRDFYSDHVLFTPRTTYLIDLDLHAMGDPALDVGNFAAHLIEQAIRTPESARALDEAAHAFVERYLQLSGTDLREQIAIYTELALARHVFISTRIEKRRAFTNVILDAVEERLRRPVRQGSLP